MLLSVLPRGGTQAVIGVIAVLLLCLSGTTVSGANSTQWLSPVISADPTLVFHPLLASLALDEDIGSPFTAPPLSTVGQTPSPRIGGRLTPMSPATGIRPGRTALWGSVTVVTMVAAYRQSQASWGPSRGKFHFKNDFTGDGMALSDEVSHLFAAYRITQILDAGYRWVGAEKLRARRLAALQAWLWTFAVEFPIDAYNPTQGFGVSDLAFNTVGVLMAHHRSRDDRPRWDVKISVKPQFFNGSARVIAQTNKQYDDYIYWLTYRPVRNQYIPLLVGAGYSTTHIAGGPVSKEIQLGVGTSLEELGGMFGESVGRYFKPLNFLFINLRTTISWK